MQLIYTYALGILGAIVGLTFADVDLWPTLPIKHRSAWTHGPLVPYGLAWLIALYPWFWPFGVGFLITYAFHLISDMFPHAWHGSAMINLFPVPLALPSLLSFVWLAVGVWYTFYTFMGLTGLAWPF